MTRASQIFSVIVIMLLTGSVLIGPVYAAGVSVTPLIIDHEGLPRDIIKGTFKITNPNHYKTTVFTVTKNIDTSKGEQKFIEPGEADHSSSLANWIDVSTKMYELQPNETKTVPYEINVNLRADKGVYHAVMFFPIGASRSEAESQISSAPQIAVNLTVGDEGKDRLQVGRFTGPGVVLGSHANFIATVNNTGNRVLKPTAEVRIYNRGGQEVGTIPVNESGDEVQPDQQREFSVDWTKAKGFGRYKAQLVMEFGDKQFQTYQDSIYFWLLPWPVLLFLVMILFGLGLLLAYTVNQMHIKRLRRQEEHYEKLMKQKIRQTKIKAKSKS